MSYFSNIVLDTSNKNLTVVALKLKRKFLLLNLKSIYTIIPGDILEIVFWNKEISFNFQGICLAIKKRSFKKSDVVFVLRNVIHSVGVEMVCSFYYNRLYNYVLKDYKSKGLFTIHRKLFYLRSLKNRETYVKD